MDMSEIRKELYRYYVPGDIANIKALAQRCFQIMDSRYQEGMSVTQQKLLQYDVVTEEFTPVLFPGVPFFYETGVLTPLSDGRRDAKNEGFLQANGWVYERNKHLFIEQDETLYGQMMAQRGEKLYLICGPYNDTSQHFNFHMRPILQVGLRGIYEKAEAELANAGNEEEAEFLQAVCHSMLCLRRMAEKFAISAEKMLVHCTDDRQRENLSWIAQTAKRVPWEKPMTLHEALATLAFLRTAVGSLEGIGPNTFGRVDVDLIGFYQADLEAGRITEQQAYERICQFLLIWDCHYDHDMVMKGYADHELENTYTLGGCDEKGEPLYNKITELFLRATRECGIIFPKIKCRFARNSPKAYLDEINRSIIRGTSVVLLENDDAMIPALVRAGRSIREARDYLISGCWGVAVPQEKYDHACYVNLLKPFEFALHRRDDKMEKVGLHFEYWDDCDSFEELYHTNLRNFRRLIEARMEVTRKGGQIYHQVDRYPVFSSTLENCVENHRDFTMGGAKYQDDFLLMLGLPNIVDSLMAIKALVFDTGKYTLSQYLAAVRGNWEGFEQLRQEAICCSGWGDGEEASCELANRLNNDLHGICQSQLGTYGGKVHMGHLTYTEIRWWGEQLLATPDGRRSGEYFSQGLTPSRLKRIPCVNDVINSMACLDPSTMAANTVINIILPGDTTLEGCEAFLRAAAGTAVEALQLNCVSRETLLDAQKHPEKYPQLIVRVTGFSVKFTSLTKEWQDEFISRNFYER